MSDVEAQAVLTEKADAQRVMDEADYALALAVVRAIHGDDAELVLVLPLPVSHQYLGVRSMLAAYVEKHGGRIVP